MITIYKTATCKYCHMVAKLCEKYGKEYQYIHIDQDLKAAADIVRKTGFRTVPVTTDGKTYINGWQPYQLVELIKNS